MSFFFNKYYRDSTVESPSARHLTSARGQAPLQAVPNQKLARPAGKRSYSPKVRDDVELVTETSRTVAEVRVSNAARRFHTMKHDHAWYTYSDVPRPYNPSDLTGWHKVYRG